MKKNIRSKHSNGQISKLIILYEEEKGFPKTKEIFAINLPTYHSLRKSLIMNITNQRKPTTSKASLTTSP